MVYIDKDLGYPCFASKNVNANGQVGVLVFFFDAGNMKTTHKFETIIKLIQEYGLVWCHLPLSLWFTIVMLNHCSCRFVVVVVVVCFCCCLLLLLLLLLLLPILVQVFSPSCQLTSMVDVHGKGWQNWQPGSHFI